MLTGRRLVGVLLILSSFLLSCSGDRESDATQVVDPSLSDFQDSILVDNQVSSAEYRRAVEESAKCMDARGWQVSDLRKGIDEISLTYFVQIATDADDADQARVERDLDFCKSTYVDAVEVEYLRSQAPTGSQRDVMLRDLVTCLESAGVKGASADSSEEQFVKAIISSLGETPEAGFFCMDTHATLFAD